MWYDICLLQKWFCRDIIIYIYISMILSDVIARCGTFNMLLHFEVKFPWFILTKEVDLCQYSGYYKIFSSLRLTGTWELV